MKSIDRYKKGKAQERNAVSGETESLIIKDCGGERGRKDERHRETGGEGG